MKEAGLCVFNNNWYQIYDFNAFEGDDSHWNLLPEVDLSSFVTEASKYIALSCEASLSLVPKTFGHKSSKDYSCLAVIFPNGTEGKRSLKLIDRVSRRSVSVLHLFFFINIECLLKETNYIMKRFFCCQGFRDRSGNEREREKYRGTNIWIFNFLLPCSDLLLLFEIFAVIPQLDRYTWSAVASSSYPRFWKSRYFRLKSTQVYYSGEQLLLWNLHQHPMTFVRSFKRKHPQAMLDPMKKSTLVLPLRQFKIKLNTFSMQATDMNAFITKTYSRGFMFLDFYSHFTLKLQENCTKEFHRYLYPVPVINPRCLALHRNSTMKDVPSDKHYL